MKSFQTTPRRSLRLAFHPQAPVLPTGKVSLVNKAGFLVLAAAAAVAIGCGSAPSTQAGSARAAGTGQTASVTPDVTKLQSKDLSPATYTGAKAKEYTAEAGDLVNVVYTGWLSTGAVFDSNDPKYAKNPTNLSPFNFTIGEGAVIKGWDQGVVGMQVGQTRELIIPPDLAYGSKGSAPTIPPNATLKFNVKLLGLVKADGQGVYDTTDVKAGTGAAAKAGDVATISFVGSLLNGRQVLSSMTLGNLTFQVKTGKMAGGQKLGAIGLAYGVEGMKVGGERKITLPPAIGTTARGAESGIPVNSILTFDVKLLKLAPANSIK